MCRRARRANRRSFGAVPDDMLAVVLRLEDRETLHALMQQAVTCPTLEALPTVQES